MFEQMDTPYRDEKQVEKKNRDDALIEDTVKNQIVNDPNLMKAFSDKQSIEDNWHMSKAWELE